MNLKDIYPLYANESLKKKYGTHYSEIATSYKNGTIEEFVFQLMRNPDYNTYADMLTDQQIENEVNKFVAVFEWLKFKQVYKFNDDLWNVIQTVEELKIDFSVFHSLPFNVFWIQHDFQTPNDNDRMYGCMVSFSVQDNIDYLVLTFFTDNYISYACLPCDVADGKTIDEIVTENESKLAQYDGDYEWFISNIRQVLNALVYLCTDRPDIAMTKSDIPNNSTIRKSSNKSKSKNNSKPLVTNTVGNNVSKVIREYKKSSAQTNSDLQNKGQGSKKSPHMRKAHYHSYWTGNKDERKLIVKFLAPMFIHGDDNEDKESKVTTIRVKGKGSDKNRE